MTLQEQIRRLEEIMHAIEHPHNPEEKNFRKLEFYALARHVMPELLVELEYWRNAVKDAKPVKDDEMCTETCAFCRESSWWKPRPDAPFPTGGTPAEVNAWQGRSSPGNDYQPIGHKPNCAWLLSQQVSCGVGLHATAEEAAHCGNHGLSQESEGEI